MFNLNKKRNIVFVLVLFFLLKLIFALKVHAVVWDEAVYLNSGKWFYSLGQSSNLESLRPILLPLFIGLFWKLKLSYVFLSELLVVLFSMGVIYLTYKISYKIVGYKGALITAILMALNPIFYHWSSFILTGIPGLFFLLLAIYLFKDSPMLSGFFAALGFLMRFPWVLFGVSIFLFVLFNRKYLKNFLYFIGGYFITIIPYFVFNYFKYVDSPTIFNAILKPLIQAKYITVQNNISNLLLNYSYYGYMVLGANILLIFFVFSFKYLKNDYYKMVLINFVLFFIYFSFFVLHKELRYSLSFLPFLTIMAGVGLYTCITKYRSRITLIVILIIILILFSQDLNQMNLRSNKMPDNLNEYYGFFNKYPISGTILTSDPIIGVYVDNKLIVAGYSYSGFDYALNDYNYSAVYITPDDLPLEGCFSESECQELKKKVLFKIANNFNLVFSNVINSKNSYIFTNVDYIPHIPKYDFLNNYNLTYSITLSRRPFNKLPVSIILEDYAQLDELGILKNKDNFDYFQKIFKNKNVSIVLIPDSLSNLNETVIPDIRDFDLIQNGYYHTDELTKDYDEQFSLLKKGKLMIENKFNKSVDAFIPPQYYATKDTLDVLDKLNFSVYISNVGDSMKPSQTRFDITTTLFKNWKYSILKTEEELKRQIDFAKVSNDNFILSLYYQKFNSSNINYVDFIMQQFDDDQLYTVDGLSKWTNLIDNVEFNTTENSLILNGPESDLSDGITLISYDSGNYSIESNYDEVNIYNSNNQDIDFCLNDDCKVISSKNITSFVLS